MKKISNILFILLFSSLCQAQFNSRPYIIVNGVVVYNEYGRDIDFRWESNGDPNTMIIEGSTGNVGLGVSPTTDLHLQAASSDNPTLFLENTDEGVFSPTIQFSKNGTTPEDGNRIARFLFRGDDDGDAQGTYSTLEIFSDDVTAGDEAGRAQLRVTMNNVLRDLFTVDGFNGSVNEGEIILNQDAQDIDTRIETIGADHAIFVQGSDGNVGIGTAAPQSVLDIAGAITADLYNFAADAQADDDYEIALPGISALTTGLMVTFTATTLNTAGATLEITSVGDLDAILKMNDQALATGDIEAGQVVVCVFDGTNWQMTSQLAQ